MTLLESFNKGKNIGFAGLCDVVGGKMWYVYNLDCSCTRYFWTKSEAYNYIKQMECHTKGYKALLRRQLSQKHGRAVCFA